MSFACGTEGVCVCVSIMDSIISSMCADNTREAVRLAQTYPQEASFAMNLHAAKTEVPSS